MDIENLRREYTEGGLRRDDLRDDPFEQFDLWFGQACKAGVLEPNAMSLATAPAGGGPTLRTVLLKKFDARGFVFFTNFGSNKARQIDGDPRVALLFPWLALERQVSVVGRAEKIPVSETVKYFVTRPLESKIGAWASPQSDVISSRGFLRMKFAEMKAKFKAGEVPVPSFWGGFRVVPEQIEFWQGGAGRLHDRFLYSREGEGWRIERLAP